MEDIQEYLREREAIAACFRMRDNKCKLSIATKSQSQLHNIIDNWGKVEREDSDIKYLFKNLAILSREEQINIIQSEIEARGATALIRSEEQEIAEICAENGASGVWYKHYGDRLEFYVKGNLDEEIMEELKQVEKSREHIYMNPPKLTWKSNSGELETLESVSSLKAEAIVNSGERLF